MPGGPARISKELLSHIDQVRSLVRRLRTRPYRDDPQRALAEGQEALGALPLPRLRRRAAGRAALAELYDLLAERAAAAGQRQKHFEWRMRAAGLARDGGRSLGSLVSDSAVSPMPAADNLLLALRLTEASRTGRNEVVRDARDRLRSSIQTSSDPKHQNLDEAERTALLWLFADPSEAAALAASRVLIARGRPGNARAALQNVLEGKRTGVSGELLFPYAWALLASGDAEAAGQVMSRLAADPQRGGEPVVRLLELLIRSGTAEDGAPSGSTALRQSEERELLNLAHRVAGDFPQGAAEVYFRIAQREMAEWRIPAAAEAAKQCVEFWPGHREARLLFVRMLARIGSERLLASAEMEARQAVRMHPFSPAAHLTLIYVLGRRLDFDGLRWRIRILRRRFRRNKSLRGLALAMWSLAAGHDKRAARALQTVEAQQVRQDADGDHLVSWWLLTQIETQAMQNNYDIDSLVAAALTLPVTAVPLDLPVLALAAARHQLDAEAVARWGEIVSSPQMVGLPSLLGGRDATSDAPAEEEGAPRSAIDDLIAACALENHDPAEAVRQYREFVLRPLADDLAVCCIDPACRRIDALQARQPELTVSLELIRQRARRRMWLLPHDLFRSG